MTTIITIHGTNAGRPEDVGDQWWQKESVFQTELAKRIAPADGSELTFFPFHWSGANSELERRKAGEALFKLSLEFERGASDYHFMGHSHGGSVAMEALRRSGTLHQTAAQFRPLEKLGSWLTVGTPFLELKKKRFLFQRLNTMGQIVFALALLLIGLSGAQVFLAFDQAAGVTGSLAEIATGDATAYGTVDEIRSAARERRNDFITVGATLGFVALVLFYPMFRSQRRLMMRYAGHTKSWLKSQYEKRWVALFDEDDEAINGISAALQLNGEIAPSNSFIGLTKLIPVVLLVGVYAVALFLSLFHLDTLLAVRDSMGANNFFVQYFELMLRAASPFAQVAGETTQVAAPQVAVASIFVAFVLLTLPLIALYAIFHFVGAAISPFLAKALDGFFWTQVKNRAFGNDTVGENVGAIDTRPREFKPQWSKLPKRINTALQDYTSEHAATTVRKARDVLGLAREQGSDNIVKTISDQLSWGELIHTAYFDVPDFVDLAAYALIETGHFKPTADFKASAGFRQAKTDYAEIKA